MFRRDTGTRGRRRRHRRRHSLTACRGASAAPPNPPRCPRRRAAGGVFPCLPGSSSRKTSGRENSSSSSRRRRPRGNAAASSSAPTRVMDFFSHGRVWVVLRNAHTHTHALALRRAHALKWSRHRVLVVVVVFRIVVLLLLPQVVEDDDLLGTTPRCGDPAHHLSDRSRTAGTVVHVLPARDSREPRADASDGLALRSRSIFRGTAWSWWWWWSEYSSATIKAYEAR